MMQVPAPPRHLPAPASAAWTRIYRHLAGRGLWVELDVLPLELAACSCAMYLAAASTPGVYPHVVEDARMNARRALADMLYIPEAKINFATMSAAGLDEDIVSVCAPLE